MIEIQRPSWHAHAACRGMTNLMYPTRSDDVREPLALCEACPVQQPCLEQALDNREIFGIWGGTPERKRRVLRRARKQESA